MGILLGHLHELPQQMKGYINKNCYLCYFAAGGGDPSRHNNVSRGSSMMPSYTLEEATEFEYLKNILYEYMMGKQQMTLAKVLTTVVKFSPEQVTTILAHEEKKASILGSILT